MWKQFSHGVAKCDQSCLVALVFCAKLYIKIGLLTGSPKKDRQARWKDTGRASDKKNGQQWHSFRWCGNRPQNFQFSFFFLRVCSLIGVNAAVTQLSRPGSGNGDDILCASAEALVFSGDGLVWPVECTFSLLSLDDEVAMKRLPTKWPAG